MKSYLLLGAALIAIPAVSALAADNVSSQDKTFVENAAIGGMAEVQEGQLAQDKAGAANVKQFGQTMVEQHTPNNQQLISLAKQKGLTPPAELDAAHQQELASLKGLSGNQFDAAYVTGQIAGHQQMQQLMQTEIAKGSDPDIKSFASTTLPVVQQHLRMAEQLQTKLGSNGTTSGSPDMAAGTTAMAGTPGAGTPGANAAATAEVTAPSGTLEKYHGGLRATELNGATVYNDQGNSIGTVNDLLVGADGKVQDVVLSIGGFLGIGTHYVSVPFDQLQVQPSRQNNAGPAAVTTGDAATQGAPAGDTQATQVSQAAAAPVGLAPPGATGVPNTTAGMTGAAQPAVAQPQRNYYSLVMPGATKQSLTSMPEFHYRG